MATEQNDDRMAHFARLRTVSTVFRQPGVRGMLFENGLVERLGGVTALLESMRQYEHERDNALYAGSSSLRFNFYLAGWLADVLHRLGEVAV